ncbi:MAG: glycerol-3-phosphate 1-O-acyltransferase PlsY [Arenicellales bacterium]|jgi:glycerol-3-phosphate acyltransferase PlsY|nr:glycerol-3-phosphate 1-O-acyltransferase PlsY [Arenicellales bacterium]HJL65422.1 glycerol-3-phosphate 1-O-acyltransferase PlsY [Arenicellales bacterium]
MEMLLVAVGAYLLGSLSSAIMVCKLAGLPDPRRAGSNNPGATNVLRLGGKGTAAATLAGDVIKGVLPVVLAKALGADLLMQITVLLLAFLGHLFPLFFRFQGGKGVATTFGGFIAFSPLLALWLMITWLLVALVTRYSSLAALVSAALSPLYGWFLFADPSVFGVNLLIVLLLIWRHRTNISRLIDGSEGRIGKS